jgi:UDP-glucuronate decarboxylase
MDSPIFEKKNVLVTGGAGFIGSHLCEKLLREANVICVDDFSNSSPENINHLLQYPDFEFINLDVNQPIDLTQFAELDKFKIKFQGVQEIYHLACPTSPADFEKLKMKSLLANSSAMINTLDLAVKYRAKYIFTSSSVVYGSASPEKFTFKEDDQGIVNHLSPRACYDEGKRFAETCVATYSQVYGLDAKIARIFTTYGPHMRLFEGQPIIDLIVNALEGKDVVVPGGENHMTTLCYVSDMVDGLVSLMATDSSVKVVNLGGDTIIKTMDAAKKIVAMTESTSQIVAGEELSFVTHPGVPDLYYTKNILGWFPLVTLEQGLAKTIEYAVANKQTLLYTHFDKLGM